MRLSGAIFGKHAAHLAQHERNAAELSAAIASQASKAVLCDLGFHAASLAVEFRFENPLNGDKYFGLHEGRTGVKARICLFFVQILRLPRS